MKSLSEIITSVKQRIALEADENAVHDLSDTAIAELVNSFADQIILGLPFEQIQGLIVPNTPIMLNLGIGTLPESFLRFGMLHNSIGKRAVFYDDFNDFQAFDGQSQLMTPDDNTPIASIAEGKIYYKPITETSVQLTYYRKHPPINDTDGTKWGSIGDKLIEDIVVSHYFAHVQDYTRAGFEQGAPNDGK